jgi:hypothetical protein
MNAFTVNAEVNDQHLLSAQVPDSIPPGPVTIVILSNAGLDDAEQAWMAGLAHEWADDLNDARQDIYTLEDGEPVNAP